MEASCFRTLCSFQPLLFNAERFYFLDKPSSGECVAAQDSDSMNAKLQLTFCLSRFSFYDKTFHCTWETGKSPRFSLKPMASPAAQLSLTHCLVLQVRSSPLSLHLCFMCVRFYYAAYRGPTHSRIRMTETRQDMKMTRSSAEYTMSFDEKTNVTGLINIFYLTLRRCAIISRHLSPYISLHLI